MIRNTTQVTRLATRPGVAAPLLATRALARSACATLGGETGRPRPIGSSRYWPNPSSAEGGRPWPSAPPHW